MNWRRRRRRSRMRLPRGTDGFSPAADLIVLDTLGKLQAHGHGMNGYCRACRRFFLVPMPVMIAVRGPDSPVIGMRPLRCAGRGEREAEVRVTAPSKGGR